MEKLARNPLKDRPGTETQEKGPQRKKCPEGMRIRITTHWLANLPSFKFTVAKEELPFWPAEEEQE